MKDADARGSPGSPGSPGSRLRLRDILGIVVSRPALRRCVPTALVVGTLLSAINQGGVILGGDATSMTWIRVVLNYVIPFTVANVGFCGAVAAQLRTRRAPPGTG